ncbi:MAG: NAD-dependent epimerase/dehydratase family protein [Cytophagales bacterium]|nr:NAD-dependent epimerase/dehydratase family protein [Cytophagales bacterium]
MKILLTGSTGYIGRRLLPVLLASGHEVICLVRDQRRFDWEDFSKEDLARISVVQGDLSNSQSLDLVPVDFDVAYYLVHSMTSSTKDFKTSEMNQPAISFTLSTEVRPDK